MNLGCGSKLHLQVVEVVLVGAEGNKVGESRKVLNAEEVVVIDDKSFDVGKGLKFYP